MHRRPGWCVRISLRFLADDHAGWRVLCGQLLQFEREPSLRGRVACRVDRLAGQPRHARLACGRKPRRAHRITNCQRWAGRLTLNDRTTLEVPDSVARRPATLRRRGHGSTAL